MEKLILIDGMVLIFRAHYAFVKNPRLTNDGRNVSAEFGFLNTLLGILDKENPTHIAVAFDTDVPTKRHIEYPAYKAQRSAIPENLITSIEEVLNGELKGWERIEALARMIFRLALREPLLLGLLREVSRPGSVGSERLKTLMTPLMDRAILWMQSEMEIGRMRRTDPRLVILSAYSTVVGLATEIEVLRAAGIEQALRPVTVRRRELIRFLRVSLDPDYSQTR